MYINAHYGIFMCINAPQNINKFTVLSILYYETCINPTHGTEVKKMRKPQDVKKILESETKEEFPPTVKVLDLEGKRFDIVSYKFAEIDGIYGTNSVAIATVKIEDKDDLKTAFFSQKVLFKRMNQFRDNNLDKIEGLTIVKKVYNNGWYFDFAL